MENMPDGKPQISESLVVMHRGTYGEPCGQKIEILLQDHYPPLTHRCKVQSYIRPQKSA